MIDAYSIGLNSYYLLCGEGCFYFVGAALPGEPRPHHKSVFDFDEVSQPPVVSDLWTNRSSVVLYLGCDVD